MTLGVIPCSQDHNFCIIDMVSEYMDRGYTCYVEYEIPLDNRPRGYRVVVDILALKENQEVLIEVGSLSPVHGDRIALLKKLRPTAKIIHITQWKNWVQRYLERPPLVSVDLTRMGERLRLEVAAKGLIKNEMS